jgi:prefoldin subunit 5
MATQSNINAYVAAVDAATAELDGLYAQAAELQDRMDQINSAIEALRPLLSQSDSSTLEQMGSELNPTRQQVDTTLGMLLV